MGIRTSTHMEWFNDWYSKFPAPKRVVLTYWLYTLIHHM